MKPKISIITAVHNGERFIGETIESVLNQTFKNFEYIIVDDCSNDNTKEIIKSFNDPRIKLLTNLKNMKPAFSRNRGILNSKGKYIAIIDADDLWNENKLKIQYDFLESNKDIFLCGTSAIFINERSNEVKRFRKYNHPNILAYRLPNSCSIIHSSVMFRNEGFFYDTDFKYSHDYELYLQMLRQNKRLTNIPLFLTKYRINPNSISFKKQKEQERFSEMVKRKYSDLKNKNIFYEMFLVLFYLRTYFEKKGIKRELALRFTDDEFKIRRLI